MRPLPSFPRIRTTPGRLRLVRFSRKCLLRQPQHPGALHYLIHSYDFRRWRIVRFLRHAYGDVAPRLLIPPYAVAHLLNARDVARLD